MIYVFAEQSMFALVLFASVCTMQWLRPDGFAVREAIRRAAKEELTLLELDMKKNKTADPEDPKDSRRKRDSPRGRE